MEEHYPTAYNLGCGPRHWDGWINVDLNPECADLTADIRDLSMIADDTADAVAAIHVLEHFYVWEAEDLLREWKRILKPGGKMILELPCMDKVCAYIVGCIRDKEDMAPFMTLHALWGDPVYKDPAMCHRFGWFQQMLNQLLTDVDMQNIQCCPPRYHFPFRDMRVEAVK